MSLASGPTGQPRRNTVNSYVLWLVNHGYNDNDIRDKVLNRFSSVNKSQVNRTISYWRQARKGANDLNNRGDNYNPERLRNLPGNDNKNVFRFRVKLQFKNTKTDEWEERGYVIDQVTGLTKGEYLQNIKNKILDELFANYNTNNQTRGMFGRKIKDIQIDLIERL